MLVAARWVDHRFIPDEPLRNTESPRTKRGFHLLTNVNNGHQRCDASVPCGGHAWSRDGLTWSNLTIGSRKIVMLSRVVALSVSLTRTASPSQTDPT